MKIQYIPIFFLLVIAVGTGCRTSSPFGHDEQDGAGFDWQNRTLVDFGTPLGLLPLHAAIEKGNLDSVSELLSGQVQLDTKDQFGATPLHIATAKGNLIVVKLLLKAGAKPNAVNFGKQTALHFAALNGNEMITHELIKAGAEVNPVDDEDWTPLDCALWKGKGIIYTKLKAKSKVAKLLLKHGGKEGEKHDH
jgi:ankyrin repeat protein